MTVEFKPWPKITRLNNARVVVTEKIDGTNACVIVQDGVVVGAQSRKRVITPDKDNMGFANWVEENKECLSQLGEGYHFGEWAGPGIQKNRHNLPYKTFFLFNTRRWAEEKPNCCSVATVLYEGVYYEGVQEDCIQYLVDNREYEPEGIVLYFPQTDHMWKYTLEHREGKWKDVPESQCAAHTEAVGGSQDSPILPQTSPIVGANSATHGEHRRKTNTAVQFS